MHDDSRQNDRFGALLSQSWRTYDRLHDQEFVVRPAIPVLYFGDSKRYLSSKFRVVTVALNPSDKEFPNHDRYSRFPAASEMATDPAKRNHANHREALDAYFHTDPYWGQWFNGIEPILNGMGVSYKHGHPNTALHTDICSPIATNPTWSALSRKQRAMLEADGVTIWRSLVDALAPDVILVSIAERYLEKIHFSAVSQWQVIWKLDRERPYQVWGKLLTIKSSRPSLLAFGRAAQTPFGTISKAKKLEMGRAIKEFYDANAK